MTIANNSKHLEKYNYISLLNAFTLAEVIITIAVLGVVAAIALPSFLAQQDNLSYTTSLKKFYSDYSQAITAKMANDGCSDLTCSGFDGGTTHNYDIGQPINLAFKDLAINFLKVDKYVEDVFISSTPYYKALDGGTPDVWYGNIDPTKNDTKFFMRLSNGMKVGNINWWGTCKANARNGECFYIIVDLNGDKLPNQYGVDTFELIVLYNGKIKGYDTLNTCFTASETAGRRMGYSCSDRIIKNNWQIDYLN